MKGREMEAREYLGQIEKIDKLTENKLIEWAQWEAKATSTTAKLGGERVQSSGSQQKMADAVIRMQEIEEQINTLVSGYLDIKQDVIGTIEKLDTMSYDLLHKRYIQCMKLYDISKTSNMSIASVKRSHKKALRKVQAILDEREKG